MKSKIAFKLTFFVFVVLFLSFILIGFYLNHRSIEFKPIILRTVFLCFSFCSSIVLIISFFYLRNLTIISSVVKDMARGDLSKRIFLNTKDELEELTAFINDMVEQMESKLTELKTNKSRLEAVFLSMFDGVMIVDQDQNILLMNQTLKDYLHIEQEPVGRKPLEIIRNVEIQEVVEEVLKIRNPLQPKEINVFLPEERILMIHAAPIIRERQQEGAVLVFHDITELRRLENVRRDFVANVSHELRTPVATIKGYAETLLDGALEDKKHAREFMQIIYSDSERLAALINDLLDLSKMESGKMKLVYSSFSLKETVERLLDLLKNQSKQNAVIITHDIDDKLMLTADETKISQVILNLMENAIKYNKLTGKVTVSADKKDKMIEVKIADTGIGIPEEDLPRIFERFYRVDKAHSRQLGGTGLGLAIVKHIIQLHGGEVFVQSKLHEGSVFSFTLPIK